MSAAHTRPSASPTAGSSACGSVSPRRASGSASCSALKTSHSGVIRASSRRSEASASTSRDGTTKQSRSAPTTVGGARSSEPTLRCKLCKHATSTPQPSRQSSATSSPELPGGACHEERPSCWQRAGVIRLGSCVQTAAAVRRPITRSMTLCSSSSLPQNSSTCGKSAAGSAPIDDPSSFSSDWRVCASRVVRSRSCWMMSKALDIAMRLLCAFKSAEP